MEPQWRRRIPEYCLSDYQASDLREVGAFAGRFERSVEDKPSRLKLHRHPHFEVFLLNGEGVCLNDFQEYRLSGWSVVAIRPGVAHAWPEVGNLSGVMLGFTRAFLEAGNDRAANLDWHRMLCSEDTTVTGKGAMEVVSLQETARMALDEYLLGRVGWTGLLRNCVRNFLLLSARLSGEQAGSETSNRAESLARDFLRLVETRFARTRELSDYAQCLGVTAGYLNEVLKERRGKTAGTLIRERVLQEGKRWLLHSEMSVSEIAYKLGFEDASYFARFFRKRTRLAPLEYRTAIREKYRRSPKECS